MEKSQQIFLLQVCLDEIETTTEYLKYINHEKEKKKKDKRFTRERGVRDITRKFRKRRWRPRMNAGGNPADCISRNSPPFCNNRLMRKKETETNERLIEGNGSCGGEFGERVPRICSRLFFLPLPSHSTWRGATSFAFLESTSGKAVRCTVIRRI